MKRISDHLLWRFNEWRRRVIIRSIGAIGEGSHVGGSSIIYSPDKLSIGARTTINEGALIMAAGGITIGDDVMIAAGCRITSSTHDKDPGRRSTLIYQPIRIEDNVWLGISATVLPGVTIGRDAIVGAGAVVTRDVAPGATVVGVPARPITDSDSTRPTA